MESCKMIHEKSVEEKQYEEAVRYLHYFQKVLEYVDEENLCDQIEIFDILEYINEYDLWDPDEWKDLTLKWKWELEQKIWEWYFSMFIENIPIEERKPYHQQRIILSK